MLYVTASFDGEDVNGREGVVTYHVPDGVPVRGDWTEADYSEAAEFVTWRYPDGSTWDSREEA